MTTEVSLEPKARTRPQFLSILLRTLGALLLSAPVIFLLLALETSPRPAAAKQLSLQELNRIETLLLESTPQTPARASLQALQLDSEELNLLLRYAIRVMNLSPNWTAQTSLDETSLRAEFSVRLGLGPLPVYVNVQALLVEDGDLLALDALTVGKLGIPDRFLQFTLERLQSNLAAGNVAYVDFSELVNNVERVEVSAQEMTVALKWDPQLISRIGNQAQQLFISDQDQRRIIDYYQLIANIAATIPSDIRAVSINAFLAPLFSAAREKSLAGSDPIAENRTAFQALAVYLNQESIAQLVGSEAAAAIEPAPFIEVRLQRRHDLAQHLASIAAITASAGADLAQMLSTTKEAYDARYRSGFSFSDLTANSVGVAMAELATASPASARTMQDRLANLQRESDYMPEVGSSRDGLSESDFNAMYTDRNSPVYQQRLADIQASIEGMPLFSGLLPLP